MADYGTHPTSLSGLSDDALFAMYRGASWTKMDESSRLELLQETVNRAAMANGEKGACRVEFADLGSATFGEQSGNVIRLDRNRFVNDIAVHEYNGKLITVPLSNANMLALETVLHEDIHAWQNQCIDGTIRCSDQNLLAEYRANNFDLSIVHTADGSTNVGQQYLSGVSRSGGYYLYYFQSTERDAHLLSQTRTMQIMERLEARFGSELSFDEYRNEVAVNGYQATLEQAKNHFVAEHVEQDINITLMNQYYGTNKPVSSAAVEESVKQEMIQSLQQSMLCSQAGPQTQVEEMPTGSQPALSAPTESPEILPDDGLEM